MKRYNIIYDYTDEYGITTLKEYADTYDEAVEIKESIEEYEYYSNIEIVDNYNVD